ncbi:hypothetical protein BJF78_23915 [Pseudonocardia sp. CNS-139]|nr:hypothetical protein BJF78_23915 [Pseudonocardia sp. CNS-139]
MVLTPRLNPPIVTVAGRFGSTRGYGAHANTSRTWRPVFSEVGRPSASRNAPPPPPSGGGVLIEALTNG